MLVTMDNDRVKTHSFETAELGWRSSYILPEGKK